MPHILESPDESYSKKLHLVAWARQRDVSCLDSLCNTHGYDIHIDAGPIHGKMMLVVVDAHSKWPEVANDTTTAPATKQLSPLPCLTQYWEFDLKVPQAEDQAPLVSRDPMHSVNIVSPRFHPVLMSFLLRNSQDHSDLVRVWLASHTTQIY